ncbi:MAG: hypothetical protein HOQ05_08625 [Corynebacteriales bacterium]|nr:hypothetical protein [Mycobacteriales bacterium]
MSGFAVLNCNRRTEFSNDRGSASEVLHDGTEMKEMGMSTAKNDTCWESNDALRVARLVDESLEKPGMIHHGLTVFILAAMFAVPLAVQLFH